MKKAKNQKGFTLIELVIVIAILGILAVIAVPRMTSLTSDAQKSACQANQRTIESAYAMSIAQGKAAADVAALVTNGYLASEPKCPSNNVAYTLTNGICTCSTASLGHNRTAASSTP